MPTTPHASLTQATGAIHPAAYVQSSDPGAVGAHKLWIDTTGSAPYQLKKRNAGDSGWDNVGVVTSLTDPTTTRGDLIARGTSTLDRLAVGAVNTLLGSNGTDPAWTSAPVVSGELTALDLKASGMTGAANSVRVVGGNASGAPASGTFAVRDMAIDSDGTIWICTSAGSPGTWTQVSGAGGGGGGAAVGSGTAQANAVGADVTMTSANTFYDGPSLSLSAGSWQLYGQVSVLDTTAAGSKITAKLWDGTTALASAESESEAAGVPFTLPVSWAVTPTVTTTYKISAASTVAANGRIKAAVTDNTAGNTASYLLAIPVPPTPLPYIRVEDQKTSGTSGGTFTSGAWRTRDLNIEVEDTHSIASLASNQITLPAGTYSVRFSSTAAACDRHQSRIQDITGAATLVLGLNSYAGFTGLQMSTTQGAGRFTLSATSAIELQHRCQTTRATDGFGYAMSWGIEVFSIVEIRKEA
jgi:hypothetical protein